MRDLDPDGDVLHQDPRPCRPYYSSRVKPYADEAVIQGPTEVHAQQRAFQKAVASRSIHQSAERGQGESQARHWRGMDRLGNQRYGGRAFDQA